VPGRRDAGRDLRPKRAAGFRSAEAPAAPPRCRMFGNAGAAPMESDRALSHECETSVKTSDTGRVEIRIFH